MIGKIFGKLTVLERTKNYVTPQGKQQRVWICLCDCGNKTKVKTNKLRGYHTKSCGCLLHKPSYNRTHNMSWHPIHAVWLNMRARCRNPNHTKYKDYGGRGITVCERWMKFENFYEDMGMRPTHKHSIERINNDGDYEPSNCKWATAIEQSKNKQRKCHLFLSPKI